MCTEFSCIYECPIKPLMSPYSKNEVEAQDPVKQLPNTGGLENNSVTESRHPRPEMYETEVYENIVRGMFKCYVSFPSFFSPSNSSAVLPTPSQTHDLFLNYCFIYVYIYECVLYTYMYISHYICIYIHICIVCVCV